MLEGVGLDPKEWTGFAAGFGVERFAMVMHQITDIREIYRNDPRFLRQGMASIDGALEERNKPFGEDDVVGWKHQVEWDGARFYNPDWGLEDDSRDSEEADDADENIAVGEDDGVHHEEDTDALA